jgi:hypothetical protein
MRGWRIALFFGIFSVFSSYLVASSQSFQHCVRERKNYQPYQALHEKGSLFAKPISRLELTVACGRVTAGQNDGAIAALATIVVAFFTFTLWRSTDKLWNETKTSIDLARSEFAATHRPRIRIKHVWLGSDIWSGEPAKIDLVVVNAGAVTAIIRSYKFTIAVFHVSAHLPPRPIFENNLSADYRELPSGFSLEIRDPTEGKIFSSQEIINLQTFSKLLCWGAIEYEDSAHTIVRTTAFARVFERTQDIPGMLGRPDRFRAIDDPDYEYED